MCVELGLWTKKEQLKGVSKQDPNEKCLDPRRKKKQEDEDNYIVKHRWERLEDHTTFWSESLKVRDNREI
jgi:heme-degrading monooxygenase HmoA